MKNDDTLVTRFVPINSSLLTCPSNLLWVFQVHDFYRSWKLGCTCFVPISFFFFFYLKYNFDRFTFYFRSINDIEWKVAVEIYSSLIHRKTKITIVEWKNNISSDKKCTRRVMILYICKGESTFHCIDATVYIHIKYIVAYRGVTLFVDSQFRVRVMK